MLQIGQVMLALPNAMANTGIRAGVPLLFVYSLFSMFTIHLLTALYAEYKARKVSTLAPAQFLSQCKKLFASDTGALLTPQYLEAFDFKDAALANVSLVIAFAILYAASVCNNK